jgi:hypothetical protein
MPLVLDMDRARAVIKSANGYGVVSAALPGAQKARIKQLVTPARKVAEEKKIPIKADVAGPLAKAKEISVKLKKSPPKEEKAASAMGYAAGFCSAVMPADSVFAKVASKTKLPVQLLKAAYFIKVAAGPAAAGVGKAVGSAGGRPPISPLWMLLGGAAIPWLAAPGIREMRYPGGHGRGRMFEHQFGGMDPRTESELANLAYRRMAVNAQHSRIARAFADANRTGYAPSISPYAMGPGGGM